MKNQIALLLCLWSPIAAAAEGATPVRTSLDWPVCLEASRDFGYVQDPVSKQIWFHAGADFDAAQSFDVRASAAGKVDMVQMHGGYGLLIDVDHGRGLRSRYGGLSTVFVKRGDTVAAGQVIGNVAADGPSHEPHFRAVTNRFDGTPPDEAPQSRRQPPHLHFELLVFNILRNPLEFFCPRTGCMNVRNHYSYRSHERDWPHWPVTQVCK